jgi:hypothetical protein
MQTLIQIVLLKKLSLPASALKSPKKICMCYLGNLSNTHSSFSQNLSFLLSILSFWNVNIENNDITRATSWYYVRNPNINNSTFLTAHTILLYTIKLYLIHDSHSTFHRKIYIHLPVRCQLCPI